jgi:ferredoxin
MRLRIDSGLCTGCGSCEEICPEVFRVTDKIVVNMLGYASDLPEFLENACLDAVDYCPVEAIIIEEQMNKRAMRA